MCCGPSMQAPSVAHGYLGDAPSNLMTKTCAVLLLASASLSVVANAENLVSLKANGWDIEADGERGTLQIRHRLLGALLENVRLGVKGPNTTHAFLKWDVVTAAENRLSIRTAQGAQ